jgi:hypothetical protein
MDAVIQWVGIRGRVEGKNGVKLPTHLLVYFAHYLHIWLHQEPAAGKQVSKQAYMPMGPNLQSVGRAN